MKNGPLDPIAKFLWRARLLPGSGLGGAEPVKGGNMEPRKIAHEPTVMGAVWRHRALFVSVVIACLAIGLIFAASQPRRWSAIATLVVEDPRASALFEQPATTASPDRYVENQAALLRSQTVAQEAVNAPEVMAVTETMLDLTEFGEALTVSSSEGSDVITVGFVAADPDLALASVNAVTEAYRELLRSEANRTFAAAIAEVGISIERWTNDLAAIQTEVAGALSSDDSRTVLRQQYEAALERLVSLQSRLSTAEVTQVGRIRAELDDVVRTFETMQLVDSIEIETPELRALLEQQSEAVRQLSALAVLRDQLAVDAELAGSGVVVVSPAEEVVPVGTDMARAAAVCLVVGSLLGAIVALLRTQRAHTLDNHIDNHVYPEPIIDNSATTTRTGLLEGSTRE